MPAITLKPTPFLRLASLGAAAASGATGLSLAATAGPLAPLLGLWASQWIRARSSAT